MRQKPTICQWKHVLWNLRNYFLNYFESEGRLANCAFSEPPRNQRHQKPEAASSSTGPRPAERTRGPYQARAVEFEPRAAARKYQNEWHVIYDPENPSTRLGPKYTRYEKYKVATTIGEARRLGSTSMDFKLDENNGSLQINYWDKVWWHEAWARPWSS